MVITTCTCRFGFPALIAANRYYKISVLPSTQASKCSIGQKLFAEQMIMPLMVAWFCFAYSINLPLIIYHSFGEDEVGICGAKKFTSVVKLMSYELSILVVFVTGNSLTGVYYYLLAKWLRKNQSVDNQVG
jgi:hypothetical protein